MTMNQYFTFPQQLIYVEKTNWSFYNRTLPKSNLKSGSAPEFVLFFMSFKNITSLRLCVCIICSLFFTYALLEAVIEKCLLNRCLFKSAKSLKNTCESIYCYYCRLQASSFPEINSFTYVLRTLQKLLPCVLGNV